MIDGAILQTFGTLLVITLLLGAGILFLKKFTKNAKSKSNTVDVQIISKISLQPKTSLIIVKAGLKTLLLGTTDHNISVLADLTEDIKYMQNRKLNGTKIPTTEQIVENKSLITPEEIRRAMLMQKSSQNANNVNPSLSFGSFLKSTFSRA